MVATHAPDAKWSLLDRSRMKLELESILGRDVDLLNRRALEKSTRRERTAEILAQAQPVYAES
jgi:predicted nucleotidyltransferase